MGARKAMVHVFSDWCVCVCVRACVCVCACACIGYMPDDFDIWSWQCPVWQTMSGGIDGPHRARAALPVCQLA